MTDGFKEFEFDLPEALLNSLVDIFAEMPSAPLKHNVVQEIPDAQGVYQLFLDGNLTYIGKTDAEAGLRKRLMRHASKIQQRVGLDPSRVTFRAVRVFVFTAVDLETQLIKHYDVETWNGSGFGANDPGRQRDTTTYKPEHYDAQYPIDIDHVLEGVTLPESGTADSYWKIIRANIPYTFRAQNAGGSSRKPHDDFLRQIKVPAETPVTVRAIVSAVVPQLPAGWQAVKLMSHVILYKETKIYPGGDILARS